MALGARNGVGNNRGNSLFMSTKEVAMHPKIVVPVEETPRSERAMPIAAMLARRLGTSLVLVSVVEWPLHDHPGHAGYHESLMRPYPDLEAESVVIKHADDTATAIVSACGPDDIICMGADHKSALTELIETSVFFDIVRNSHRAVVAVGPHAEIPEFATDLVLCVDGLEHAEQGLVLIPKVAQPAGLRPVLVQVLKKNLPATPDVTESAYLHRLTAHDGPASGVDWDVLHGDPVKSISSYCSSPKVAAIGFATDALDPLARMFTPSLANELIKSATRPLVLVATERKVTIQRHKIPASAVKQ